MTNKVYYGDLGVMRVGDDELHSARRAHLGSKGAGLAQLMVPETRHRCVIPTRADQNRYAQSRIPMDMMRQGCSTSLFHASQQWSTMSS